jgi:hypothetical protein
MNELNERLDQLRSWRDSMRETLEKKIAEVRKEREEMVAQYDEELAILSSELQTLGVNIEMDMPGDVAVKAYNFLREHPGEWFTSARLMESIRCVGAVASLVLRPFTVSGKIQITGEGRGTRYSVEATE